MVKELVAKSAKLFVSTKLNFVAVVTRGAAEIYVADIERAESGRGITVPPIKQVFNLSQFL